MKVGDLVRVSVCDDGIDPGDECGCWFCSNDSNRTGIIIRRQGSDPLEDLAPTAKAFHGGYWSVMFDVGEWRLYGTEMEVISESR